MTSAKVRWGFLSTARINRRILAAAEKSELAEVVAVASRDADRAEAYAVEHGIPRSHGSYEALIEDPDVDAVYISLPNSLHAEWSARALAAGKHVLCEKPLTRSPEDAEKAFDAAERDGRILMEAFMWRHSPQTAKLVQLVEGGVIGELQLVRATFSFPLEGRRNIRLDPDLDGGALMDVGAYCVSAARLLAGEPERVYGEQVIGDSGVDVLFTGVLRFPGECSLRSTRACTSRGAMVSRRWAPKARSSFPTRGSLSASSCTCVAARAGRRSRSRRQTPIASSWTTCAPRSPARPSRSSGATTRWGRREPSRRSTGQPTRAVRSSSSRL